MWSDGTTIWVADYDDDKLYAYTLDGGGRDSGKDVSVSSAYTIWGIWSDDDTIWVVDQAGDYVHDYALPKTPTDATLSGLTLSAGTLDPTFAGATEEYAVSVNNGVASVTVTAAATDANAALAITYGSDATLATGGVVPLSVGPNSITVTPVVGTAKTYTLTVTRRPLASITVVWTQGGAAQQYEVSWTDGEACASTERYYAYVSVGTTQITFELAIGDVAVSENAVTGTVSGWATSHTVHTVAVSCGNYEVPGGHRVVESVDLTGTTGGTFQHPPPADSLPIIDSLDGQDVGGPFRVRFTFLKAANLMEAFPVTGFVLGDITVSNGTASNLVKAHGDDKFDGVIWEATITPVVRGGGHDVVVSLAAGVVTEGNQAASLTVTTRADTVAPTATLRANVVYFEDGSQSTVITRPTGLHIGFDERVTGLEINDFELTNGQLQVGYLDVDADGNGHAVLVPKVSGPVQVAVRLKAGAVHDLAGNPNAATQVVLHVSPDETPPEIVRIRERLRRVDDDGTYVWALTFVFSEPVTGFTANDVDISSNGTKSTESRANHAYGTRWAIDIESDDGETPITVSVAARAFSDGNNNTKAFSGEIDRTVPPPASDD